MKKRIIKLEVTTVEMNKIVSGLFKLATIDRQVARSLKNSPDMEMIMNARMQTAIETEELAEKLQKIYFDKI